MEKKGKKDRTSAPGGNLGGILSGLGEILERLGDLADKGIELSNVSELGKEGESKNLKGVYGFSVKLGLGGDSPKIEPFGNIRKDEKTGQSVVHEIREPIIDVFEEENHLLIVAELPGILGEDVSVEVKDDILTLHAARKDRKYQKEVLLPRHCLPESLTYTCNSGVLEVKLDYVQR